MLPGGLDAMYRRALTTSHEAFRQVDVLDGGRNVLVEDLEFEGGTVDATLSSRVARTAQVIFKEDMYPFLADGLLAPYGNMIRISAGIRFADGSTRAWTIFLGRIQATRLDGALCTVYASDLATEVSDAKFLKPENSVVGLEVTQQMMTLISDGYNDAHFGASDSSPVRTRALAWQLDRSSALDELATTIGFFWYPLANGDFVLRRYPWTVLTPAVVTYADGDFGSVVTSSAERSREGVYNSLTVTGERLNGEDAVFAIAQDTNVNSATYINGTFGRRHQLLRLQTPGTQGAADGAAADNLRRLASLVDSWDWSMTVDAALELGDTIALAVRGRPPVIQVVSSFRIPLELSGVMSVSGRSQIVGVLEGVE